MEGRRRAISATPRALASRALSTHLGHFWSELIISTTLLCMRGAAFSPPAVQGGTVNKFLLPSLFSRVKQNFSQATSYLLMEPFMCYRAWGLYIDWGQFRLALCWGALIETHDSSVVNSQF